MSAWQRKGGERHDHSPRRASPAPPSGGTHRLVPDPLATRDTDQASNLRAQPPPFRQLGEKSGPRLRTSARVGTITQSQGAPTKKPRLRGAARERMARRRLAATRV